jgi:cardiolipin synthase
VWARARRLIWSWLFWGLLALAAANWAHWIAFTILVALAFIAHLFAPPELSPAYGLDHEFSIDSDEFLGTIAGATDTPFSLGNRVDILNNGDEFYPRMLDDIGDAQRTITMEAYIYWAGMIGLRFAEALASKAREGVTVKLLFDAVGSANISDEILDTLTAAGCQIAWYHPVHWYTLRRVNNRTHRKSLIVDGRVGYTGGAGIADHWLGNAEGPEHWRDVNIRIAGPAVATLQSARSRRIGSRRRTSSSPGSTTSRGPRSPARSQSRRSSARPRPVPRRSVRSITSRSSARESRSISRTRTSSRTTRRSTRS